MKIIKLSEIGNRPFFQGDIMLIAVAVSEAENAKRRENNVVALSETHHHHVAEGGVTFGVDPMIMFLRPDGSKVEGGVPYVDVVHHRPWDTHESYRLFFDVPDVVVKIKRQREYVPQGWRRVED